MVDLDFVNYVDSFYNENEGIYPIKGMTKLMIVEAFQKHINTDGVDYCGDSFDREQVRDIILDNNNVKWLG